MLPGVYEARKKDGAIYYRSSITYQNKHISLGSFSNEADAHSAYASASTLLTDTTYTLSDHRLRNSPLSFDKIVTLINFRDNRLYIATPIYLKRGYFSYYLTSKEELKFDIDDLFYYTRHKIMRRQGHLFVNDYGMQVTILSRYGIKSHAVCGKDYLFINGDTLDYRYANIKVINPYYGVTRITKKGIYHYLARIHINGNYTIGVYRSDIKAAIAYNKAIDYARKYNVNRNFNENYIEDLSASEYAEIYTKIKISSKYIDYLGTITS